MEYTTVIKPAGSIDAKQYIAYKGFDKDLKCKGFQFEIGKEYKSECTTSPKLCSKDGFRYCDELKQVFSHYPHNGSNRFCLIEIIGLFNKSTDKAISVHIKIISEIPASAIDEMLMDESMQIKTIQAIQTKYPLIQVGGSIALYIYGIRLQRFKDSCDIDLCMPYWQNIEADENIAIGDEEAELEKFYTNDFEQTIFINGIKADIRVDPKQKYSIVEYKGFKYRCASFDIIMEAKFRYAMKCNRKHMEDVRQICLPAKFVSKPTEPLQLPFKIKLYAPLNLHPRYHYWPSIGAGNFMDSRKELS